jgi:hypothetical protein
MWYSRVVSNLGAIPDFIAHYETGTRIRQASIAELAA